MKYHFNDVTIVPEIFSEKNTRKSITFKHKENDRNLLPIIVAPMDRVISLEKNSFNKDFVKQLNLMDIPVCYPRNYTGNIIKGNFKSISLQEAEDIIKTAILPHKHILIDVANGHMEKLYNISKNLKEIFGNSIILMIGNIANPKTFEKYCEIDVDYIRLGIGSGNVCTTSANAAIHYPLASLIKECYTIKKEKDFTDTKIIADGGFNNYDEIIKALALGADYVMSGSIFNKMIESDATPYLFKKIPIKSYSLAYFLFKKKIPLYKEYRGMSTKKVQKLWKKEKLTTSEGIYKFNKVEYTLKGWVENFSDYLKSTMSYTNSNDLIDFIGEVEIIHITQNAFKSYHK